MRSIRGTAARALAGSGAFACGVRGAVAVQPEDAPTTMQPTFSRPGGPRKSIGSQHLVACTPFSSLPRSSTWGWLELQPKFSLLRPGSGREDSGSDTAVPLAWSSDTFPCGYCWVRFGFFGKMRICSECKPRSGQPRRRRFALRLLGRVSRGHLARRVIGSRALGGWELWLGLN